MGGGDWFEILDWLLGGCRWWWWMLVKLLDLGKMRVFSGERRWLVEQSCLFVTGVLECLCDARRILMGVGLLV